MAGISIHKLLRNLTLMTAFAGTAGCAGQLSNYGTNNIRPYPCVTTSDTAKMRKKIPLHSMAQDSLRRIRQIGVPVYEAITEDGNGVQGCIYRVQNRRAIYASFYQNDEKRAVVPSNASIISVAHEYFHATQVMGPFNTPPHALSQKDAAIAWMLKEATAIAYEIALRHEAAENGMKLVLSPIDSLHSRHVETFRVAHDSMWNRTEGLEPDTLRKAKALEAGGKAVVRSLLNGDDADWRNVYVREISNRVRLAIIDDGRETKPDYKAKRWNVYQTQGFLSETINFTPDELLLFNSDEYISEVFSRLGFQEQKLRTPQKRTPGR